MARKVSLKRLLADPSAYQGNCVSFVGYWASRAAFSEPMAARKRYSNAAPDVARFRIGLYLPEDGREPMPPEPVRARVVGIVSDCACLYGPDTIMVLGYCHYTSGPIVDVRRIQALE